MESIDMTTMVGILAITGVVVAAVKVTKIVVPKLENQYSNLIPVVALIWAMVFTWPFVWGNLMLMIFGTFQVAIGAIGLNSGTKNTLGK